MAVKNVPEYAHLSESDVAELGRRLDAIRARIEESRGERDAKYIRNTIRFQRALEVTGRALTVGARRRSLWWLGASALGVAKIVENMEIGHNVMHGQWDWMNDPEIHSTGWEWDNAGPSEHWKQTHNYIHHKYTNVLGMDDDVGYGLLRVTRDQKWAPFYLGNLVYNTLLAVGFEYGVAAQYLEIGKIGRKNFDRAEFDRKLGEVGEKVGRQILKDYVVHPALVGGVTRSRSGWRAALTSNLMANAIRNVWSNAIIFCGHFPDGAEKFVKQDVDSETQGEWYLRQMLGSANFHCGPVLAFMSGNLSFQIEHHLFPDLPSNRLREISLEVKELCDEYDLPYTIGPFPVQYAKSWRTIAKLSLPNKYLRDTRDDAPETASEERFRDDSAVRLVATIDPVTGKRRGLRSAMATARARRRDKALAKVSRLVPTSRGADRAA
ncbi:fatty acid desaturase family protein [Williamsia sp. MIQD14]|uniref:fatty acid desaturase family protein n=1 Tax=Williamsia sp. MIQD14 TaxID=3425703 RepID=UPI003DA18BDA